MAGGDFLHHQTCLVSPSSGAPGVSNPFQLPSAFNEFNPIACSPYPLPRHHVRRGHFESTLQDILLIEHMKEMPYTLSWSCSATVCPSKILEASSVLLLYFIVINLLYTLRRDICKPNKVFTIGHLDLNCRYYYGDYYRIEITKGGNHEESTSSLALLKPSINVEANTSSCVAPKNLCRMYFWDC